LEVDFGIDWRLFLGVDFGIDLKVFCVEVKIVFWINSRVVFGRDF
jgi:hypothetical protein